MQGINNNQTIQQLLFSYKGSKVLTAEINDFKICRATPSGKANPEAC